MNERKYSNQSNQSIQSFHSLLLCHLHMDDTNPNVICPICYNALAFFDVISELTCKHKFHNDCIIKWISKNNSCPLCRKKDRMVELFGYFSN